MNMETFELEVEEWAKQFDDDEPYRALLCIMEEVGELSHAELKSLQGIRLDQDHEAMGKDAVGDIVIALAHYCGLKEWSLADCVRETWEKVKKRNYNKGAERTGREHGETE